MHQIHGKVYMGTPNQRELLEIIEKNRLCVVPPNQEATDWTVYANLDGGFGYDEIGAGATLTEALEMAAAVVADTEDVR
jgi:hypothetical protein